MGKYRITIDGKIYTMEIEILDENVSETKAPHNSNQVLEKEKEQQPILDGKTVDRVGDFANVVSSPISGTVVKFFHKIGDQVEPDEPVLLIEAMKMENEVCAKVKCKIKNFFVKEGQSISSKQNLFEIETEE